MPSNHLILCGPLLLLPSIFPRITVFSNESTLCIRWPKYWTVSSSVLPMNIQDWFPLGLTGMISLQSIYRLSVNVNNYVCLIKFVGMILVNLCQGHNNNKLYFKGYYFLGKFSFVGSFSTFPHFIYWVWYFKDTYYYYVYLPYLLASHWSALSFTYI